MSKGRENTERLLDESERILYESIEDNRHMPHLLRAINLVRIDLGMKELILSIKEKQK